MTVKTIRSFAIGLLLATSVCGIVYFLSPDPGEAKVTKAKEKLSEEEMKMALSSQGYVILTEEEYQKQPNAQVTEKEKEKPAATESKESTEKQAAPQEKIVYRTVLTVSSGMTSIDVGRALVSAQIIPNALEFSNRVESLGVAEGLRLGTFEINSSMTMDQIIAMVFKKR